MEQHDSGEASVIPIILRPSPWMGNDTPFGKLQALPEDGKAITLWENQDEAFLNVAEGIKKAIIDRL